MVEVGGNEIHIKYVKSRQIFLKQGKNNNFRETGGGKYTEIGGNSKFVVDD